MKRRRKRKREKSARGAGDEKFAADDQAEEGAGEENITALDELLPFQARMQDCSPTIFT